MSTPVRRPRDGPPSPPRSAAPPHTRRLKKRHHTGFVVLAVIIGFGIYASNRHTYHSPQATHDRSDLSLVPATVSIPPGGTGNSGTVTNVLRTQQYGHHADVHQVAHTGRQAAP